MNSAQISYLFSATTGSLDESLHILVFHHRLYKQLDFTTNFRIKSTIYKQNFENLHNIWYNLVMNEYEKYKIQTKSNIASPNHNTIYYWLKNNGFSEHHIKLLRKKSQSFMLNGVYCNINQSLNDKDVLEVLKNPRKASNIISCDGDIDVLYEDDCYLIVNKPHLLASIPTRSHITDNLGGRICNYMRKKDSNFVLRIVNRLDKDTAGIVVVAKDIMSYNNLKDMEKTYYALCQGVFPQKAMTIDKPILTITHDGINQMKRVVSEKGKPAITHVEVEKVFGGFSLLKLNLETGRTHQIRVHLSNEGFPLLGDNLYSEEKTSLPHTFLLLKKISFTHYKTGQKISLEVPFPNDWKQFLTGDF